MKTFKANFVEFIPEDIEEGILYISMKYKSVVHNCACGCRSRIITPLSPTDWRVIYNGQELSLYPSIGNWNLECRSHYWIKKNKVVWSSGWSQEQIDENRSFDYQNKKEYYESRQFSNETSKVETESPTNTFWERLLKWMKFFK